jgi:hypothetical protein
VSSLHTLAIELSPDVKNGWSEILFEPKQVCRNSLLEMPEMVMNLINLLSSNSSGKALGN